MPAVLKFTPPIPADDYEEYTESDDSFVEETGSALSPKQIADMIESLEISATTLALAAIVSAAENIPGCTCEVRGRETEDPVVWMYGIEKAYRDEAKALGARWSPTKQAWWVTISRFKDPAQETDET